MTFTLTNNSAIVVKQDGRDVRVLKLPGIELRGYPVVWDGRDEQGNLVPLGDYQLLFYTANHAGLFGSYSAAFRVVDGLPVGGVEPVAVPLVPIESSVPPSNQQLGRRSKQNTLSDCSVSFGSLVLDRSA
ncbi:MAG: hypothetical protein JXB07_02025, partial [Anaerolineae bacterium]|nr:hypothetical protein [Anaerolineae bacterium]